MKSEPKLEKVEFQYNNHQEMRKNGFPIDDDESWVLSFVFDNGISVRISILDIYASQHISMEEINAALEIAMDNR